jgi:hypothetical protein
MADEIYNPLDKPNLAKSIELELLSRDPSPISEAAQVEGAGVYVIYYTGAFKAYSQLSASNSGGEFKRPIYIGKAIPKGGRKGGFAEANKKSTALRSRLRQHASSIEEASNLDVSDFYVRHLVVDDIWIPLGENMLIQTFKPVWNHAIDGFGNKDPGNRRKTQYRSPWDVLHPGRYFAEKLADGGITIEFLERRVADYLAGRRLERLPKVIAEQIEEEQQAAEESADDA